MKFLDVDRYQPKALTRIVFGPHGSGKSAAVINVLKGRKGVVHVHIRNNEDKDLVQQILRILSVSVPQGTDPTCLLEGALQDIHRRWDRDTSDKNIDLTYLSFFEEVLQDIQITPDPDEKKPQPILVVDVNQRVDSESLDNILLLLKSWGSDSGWIKPIVMLTSMRATLGLQIPRLEQRAEFFKIDDLDEDECKLYHEGLCRMIEGKCTDNCKSEISKILPPAKWNWFLALNTLAQNNISSLSELKKVVESLEREQNEIYMNAFTTFITEMKERKYTGEHHVLRSFMEEKSVHLRDFCKEYGLSEDKIIEIIVNIKPHPFYINPQTREVYIGSKFMIPALKECCEENIDSDNKVV